jgi:hypothetical protein
MNKQERPYWKKIPGRDMQDAEREYLMTMAGDVARRFSDPLIVNIGVKGGTSLHCLYLGAKRARFLAIDIDLNYYPLHQPDMLPDTIEFVEADSARYEVKEDAHLVFIDGDHLYYGVRGDIENWTPHIPDGGLVIFHDYAPNARDRRRLKGVRYAVDDWQQQAKGWERLTAPGSLAVFRRTK